MEKTIASPESETPNLKNNPLPANSNSGICYALNVKRVTMWHSFLKRSIDIAGAASSLIILSPLMLFVALRTKFSVDGSVIYKQERVGYTGKTFCIYKFRSMYTDAEKSGPLLSHENDVRITKWGRKMRKWKLDELPQLWNILKGEMSFIGPRPERKYYIEQIADYTSSFAYLLKVKPGLTSFGMVEFGYASNVKDMVRRMQYDLFYVKNNSLLLDCKIALHTLRIVFSGKGK